MRVRITATDSKPATMSLARALRITPRDAGALLAVARVLPAELDAATAAALATELRSHGVSADVVDVPPSNSRCDVHPSLTTDASCETCRKSVCPLCLPRCPSCRARESRAARWKRLRVAMLLVVLLSVCLWGVWKHLQRERRHAWLKPLRVNVVLVSPEPVDEQTREAWRTGVHDLEEWFVAEAARYEFHFARPLRFELAPDVVRGDAPEVSTATGEWLVDSQRALELREQLRQLVNESDADVSVVVALRMSVDGPHRVEGLGEAGGTVGLVDGTNGDTSITLELVALAHEVLHLLGAKDGYDQAGHAQKPRGFVEPELGYAQHFAEVMVGEIPVSATEGKIPGELSDVRIGEVTALEIGWR